MKPKHVIVCLIDAAGAGHMSCYGYHRKTTPNIDALAADGIIFRRCFTPGDFTMVGCGSFHTGRYAEGHGAYYLERRLKDDDLTFAETMRRAGYVAGGFSANTYANSYMGFHVGFDHFDDMKEGLKGSRQRGTDEMYECEQRCHERFNAWMEQAAGQSVFAYVHFQPPHGDYEAPMSFRYRWANPAHWIPNTSADALEAWEQGKAPFTQQDVDYVRDLYDENMFYADYNVGLVIRKLKDLGVWDDALFIALSDHGEAFMEHGFTLHNTTLYDEMIHVPLILKRPKGMDFECKDIDALVELIDIYPTVAEMIGVELPNGTVDGKSFLPLLTGEADKIKDYTLSRSAHNLTPILSVRTLKHKYIFNQMTGTRELYDLESDPLEKSNIMDGNSSLAAELHKLLEPALEYYRKEIEKQS
ncbi:MAG: sulfatase [Armatimonadota bacterium]|nr:sulfatase [Armatimonadota bacterium]